MEFKKSRLLYLSTNRNVLSVNEHLVIQSNIILQECIKNFLETKDYTLKKLLTYNTSQVNVLCNVIQLILMCCFEERKQLKYILIGYRCISSIVYLFYTM